MVRNVFSELEAWTGSPFSLETWNHTDNPNTVGRGVGVETPEDWTSARRKGSLARGTDGTELSDDEKYLRYILGAESINVIGVLSLAKAFDFGKYRSIFEIGCGDMAQAYVIHRLYPHVKYVATDFDPYVIDRCSQLSGLAGIEKGVLDVLSLPSEDVPFAGFDLLASWGMEYALNDEQFLQLLRKVQQSRVPYLMCSATTIGLVQYARHRRAAKQKQTLVDQGKLRKTGWLRSVGRFRHLAQQSGLKTQALGRFGYHFCVLFTHS